ncbi:MAG: glycosyl transferase family 1, partial [Pseudomonadota bacterium]
FKGIWPNDRCDVICAQTTQSLALHPGDQIIATAWWTAHIAADMVDQASLKSPFWYLIQDYEPCFYPWGTEYAAARASYDLRYNAIFNSAYLRDYFVDLGCAAPTDLCFQPAIQTQAFQTPRPERSGPKRLMVYGRPDVARNLFPLCVDALGTWLETAKLGPHDLEIVSLGQPHQDIELPGDLIMRSLGKLSWADYPKYLATVDMGLSLMCSPHPSHPPIELAMAGAQVVTNTFGAKQMHSLAPNLIATGLARSDIVAGLDRAWHATAVAPQTIDLAVMGPTFDQMLDTLNAALRPKARTAA